MSSVEWDAEKCKQLYLFSRLSSGVALGVASSLPRFGLQSCFNPEIPGRKLPAALTVTKLSSAKFEPPVQKIIHLRLSCSVSVTLSILRLVVRSHIFLHGESVCQRVCLMKLKIKRSSQIQPYKVVWARAKDNIINRSCMLSIMTITESPAPASGLQGNKSIKSSSSFSIKTKLTSYWFQM